MIAITPERMFTAQQFKVLRDQARRNALGAVRGATAQNLVTRPLLPTDLFGAQTANFWNSVAIAAANTPTQMTPLVKVPQVTGYAIFGYASLLATDHLVEMWLGNGANTWAKIRLSPLYAEGTAGSRIGYFDPVYFNQNDNVLLTLTADAAVLINAALFELIGVVAETPTNVGIQQPQAPGQSATVVDG
jgi:hypothetical protein